MLQRPRAGRDAVKKEIQLEITPLIDVVFLILIFFMCTLQFKDSRKKFVTYLPTHEGLGTKEQPLETLVPEVALRVPAADRALSPMKRRVLFVMGATNKIFGQAVFKGSEDAEAEIEFSPANTKSRIVAYLNEIREADPTVDEVKIRCDPRVPYAYTAAMIGITKLAKYKRIKYAGIPGTTMDALAKGDL